MWRSLPTILSLLAFVSLSPAAAQEEPPEKAPVLAPPALVEYVQAEYPAEAFAAGIEADVVAELVVGTDGTVTGITITEPAGQGFDEAAEAAMRQFRFEPATRDGEPIAARVLYRYSFFIEAEAPPEEELPPPSANLGGKVTDMNGAPIDGASVILTPVSATAEADTEEGADKDEPVDEVDDPPPPATTAEDGTFSFESIPPGAYQIDLVAPGFKPFSATEELEDGEIREVIYRLETEEVLYETVVRARRPPREVTRREITRREITRIPGTGGDALRSLQNLPGMARASFISGELIIRGSSPQDSQYYFDQMPVPLLYHFGGLTSIINSDLLERIDMYPGNYSVRYGGATGGIVDVYPRAPATDRFHGYIDADFWDIGALLETPIGDDWSIAVSGRRSYVAELLSAAIPDDGGFSFTVAPRYYDYQLVADYHPDSKDNLRLFFFGTDDKLVFLFGEDVASNPNISGGADVSIYIHQGQSRWKHRFSKTASNDLNVAAGFLGTNTSVGNFLKFNVKQAPVYLRDEFEYDDGGLLGLRTGIDSAVTWGEWKIRAPSVVAAEGENPDPLSANEEIIETSGSDVDVRAAWYGELELRPVERLRLINGLRVEYFNQVQQTALDPRFVLRYEVIEGTTLKGGLGLFHQRPQIRETDGDYGNPDLSLISAIHYSVGVEQRIIENLEAGVEGFYKDISNLVVSSDELTESEGELVPERFNNDGVGKVYGLEFLLKHHDNGRFFGWVSYTIMKSGRIDHPGEKERLFDYDQTHILTLVANLVLGRGWEAGVRFRLVSGNPDTPIEGSVYDSDSDVYFPIYGETNSTRLPTFHQLDLRIDKKWDRKALKYSVYIDVQNVYNHKNPEGWEYNYDFTKRQFFYGLPILPSLGMKLEY